jgi:hypothetical protein
LTNRHIGFKVLEITDPLIFTLETGLAATPETLVIDKEKRLLLEFTGQMDEPVESEFRRVLHEGQPPRRKIRTLNLGLLNWPRHSTRKRKVSQSRSALVPRTARLARPVVLQSGSIGLQRRFTPI